MGMNRRDLLKVAGLFAPIFFLFGCGGNAKSKSLGDGTVNGAGDGDDPNAEPVSACEEGSTIVYTNPGHVHTITPLTAIELENAVPGQYRLMEGDHAHMITLTAGDFRDLKNGKPVDKMDSERHGHMITISC